MKDKLNVFLSNLAVLNAKLHNIHWNIVGPEFLDMHGFTEKLYTEVQAQYDAVAEAQKMTGKMPMVKVSDFLKNTTIKEVNAKDFNMAEALKLIEADLKEMMTLAEEIHEQAEKDEETPVVVLFEDYLLKYAKYLWFVRAMQGK